MSLEKPLYLNNKSNLETLENEVSLTASEKTEFRKLPKKEREKRNKEKLAELTDLNVKHAEFVKEAAETGDQEKLEKAKVIKEQIEKGIKDLEQQVNINDVIPTAHDFAIFEEIRIGKFSNIRTLTAITPEIFEILKPYISRHSSGGLDLSGLTSAEGLIFPKVFHYEMGLDLSGLTSAEGLTLPAIVKGSLDLSGLTSAEGLTLPVYVDGWLNLSGLTSAEGLTLPVYVGGQLSLSGLTSEEKDKLREKNPQNKDDI